MRYNIVCDHRLRPGWKLAGLPKGPVVFLSVCPDRGNVYFEPPRLEASLGLSLDPLTRDLCEIASYIYIADKVVPRGRYEKWVRDLSFVVPVRVPARWNEVETLLTNTVSTLSGDNVRFRFVRKEEAPRLPTPEDPTGFDRDVAPSDCVSLFSGGLDSYAGALYLAEQGRRPLLSSHYVSGLKALQLKLAASLGDDPTKNFEHVQYRVTTRRPATGSRALTLKGNEGTYRARSFLFMSFAAAAAAVRGLSEIYICENGVLALNVPLSDARKGTRSTRHAHPLYLTYFNQLIDALYRRRFSVRNPFLYWTKREEVELIATARRQAMIRETVSCWGYPNLTLHYKDSNHCGTCIPCLVRRVSMIAAGLEDYDDRYVVDAFRAFAPGPAGRPNNLRNVEDLIFFARAFSTSSKSTLLYRYPELMMVESAAEEVHGSRIDTMIDVYRRFAKDVLAIAVQRAPHLLDQQAA